jgi:hypothetical protein
MQLVSELPGGRVANIEKHLKFRVEIDKADSNVIPMRERGTHLVGRSINGCQNDDHAHPPHNEVHARVILRLDELPATPRNLERIRERIRVLNERLAGSGTPLRLRII